MLQCSGCSDAKSPSTSDSTSSVWQLARAVPISLAIRDSPSEMVYVGCITRKDGAAADELIVQGELIQFQSDQETRRVNFDDFLPFSVQVATSAGRPSVVVGLGSLRSNRRLDYSHPAVGQFRSAGAVVLLDTDLSKTIKRIETTWTVLSVAVSPKANRMVAVGADDSGRVRCSIWNWADLTEVASHKFSGSTPAFPSPIPIQLATFTHDGASILVSTTASSNSGAMSVREADANSGVICVLDSKSGQVFQEIHTDHPSSFIDISRKSNRLACSAEGTCTLYDLELTASSVKSSASQLLDRDCIAKFDHALEDHLIGVRQTASSVNRTPIEASVFELKRRDAANIVWEATKTFYDESKTSVSHRNISMAMSGNDRLLAIGTDDGRVLVWGTD